MKTISDISVARFARPAAAQPGALFRTGAGCWFDTSRLDLMTQDAEGTQPVTELPGLPVGRLRDQSPNRLDATQPVAAARPLLARHPRRGLANLHPLSAASDRWVAEATTPPAVTLNATHLGQAAATFRFTPQMQAGYANCRSTRTTVSVPIVQGRTYTTSWHVALSRALTGAEAIGLYFTGTAGQGMVTLTAQNSAPLVGAWQRLSASQASAGTGFARPVVFLSGGVGSDVTLYVSRVQFEAGPQMTGYQAVQSLLDVTETGQAPLWHLAFDGVDDHLRTAALDLTARPEVTCAASLLKFTDTGRACLLSQGAALAQSFNLLAAPAAGSGAFAYETGQIAAQRSESNALPRPFVVLGDGDLSAPSRRLRVNGAEAAVSTGQPAPGHRNEPLWLGSAGTTSVQGDYFSGRLYGLAMLARRLAPSEVSLLEGWLARRSGLA